LLLLETVKQLSKKE
jgi:hypothetical protein